MNLKINWDALGITASVACAIHCAVLPLFLTSLPVLGFEIIDNIAFEYLMIILAFAIGAYSLYHGWKKHHHSWAPFIIFSAGIALLFAKQLWHNYQLWFLLPAVVLVVAAHYVNYRLCRKAKHCHEHDCSH
ncbi:MerC domain-containing protein [Foetidibacter luteolus]|uniref:MerC domain-containing protein n=1 Tax=Foetidibacter luteolus TaxID=2608880 RepID=UPI00129B9530|nr:MerC domain-containing protein [Foetidibacter luteolus]